MSGEANMHLRNKIQNFVVDTNGATAIEYGLISSLMAVALVTIWMALGTRMSGVFSEISAALI